MEDESGEQVGGELESVTSSAGCFMQGWRNEPGSWFQRWGDAYSEMSDWWFLETKMGVVERGWQQMRS